ncbi:MAG: GNAT family N-acetyltransferase [Stenotrophomonas sp.]
MNTSLAIRIETADYPGRQEQLHALRRAVFVDEQQVPAELETDELDPLSHHVIALDAAGQVIGTGRLTPQRRIGRMAVAAGWRNRDVGAALLQALVAEAERRNWGEVALHAQVAARNFYIRNGFLPEGVEFEEAGIRHQTMRRRLDGPMHVQDMSQGIAAATAVAHRARRRLLLHCRGSDASLLGQPALLQALRHFASARHDKQALVLLHDGDLQALPTALLALMQRLPSVFALRGPVDPADAAVASAVVINDNGDCYFRPMGERPQGELSLDAPARAQVHEMQFQRLWERAHDCPGLRTLGI